ncbi:MAG: hypothetical protein LBD32_00070 [Cytophagales bacterium]|jgi:hypothetical protein|nr:hypothetical protein [Cytophagales bacterium]
MFLKKKKLVEEVNVVLEFSENSEIEFQKFILGRSFRNEERKIRKEVLLKNNFV